MLVAEKKGFNISDNRYRKYDERFAEIIYGLF